MLIAKARWLAVQATACLCSRSSSPSMSTLGRMRPSHFGIHHAALPNRVMSAGTSVMRTRNASNAMPTASPRAMPLMVPPPSGTNAKKTKNMMSAAAVTTRAPFAKPTATARRASPNRTYCSRMPETRNTS